MPKYAYSLNQERYYGEFDTREDALANGRGDSEGGTVWTGEIKTAADTLSDFAENLGERIVEEADLILMDEIAADDVIVELSRDQREELGKLVIDYLREHATWLAWSVVATQEHPQDRAMVRAAKMTALWSRDPHEQ